MVIPVVCLVAVALVSPWSALILFLMAPLIPVFMIMIGRGAERLNQRQWLQITRLAVRFHEALDKISLLKLFNIERSEIEKIARLTKRWRVETMQVLRIAFLSALVLEFFSTCGVALCAIFLGFAVYEKGFDYTTALFVLLIAPEFFIPLRQLGANYHARMKAIGAMANLTDLLAEKDVFKISAKDIYDAPSAANTETTSTAADDSLNDKLEADAKAKAVAESDSQAKAAAESDSQATSEATTETDAIAEVDAANVKAQCNNEDGVASWLKPPFNITLNNVTAIYPNGRIGMKDVSAILESQCITALIGPSGVGKSTLLQTIAGFTRRKSGDIVVNGHVCSHDDLIKLMSHISYIPQLPNLFYGTLRDNLKIGAPKASDDELKKALEIVGASDLLKRFKDGLDHHVGNQNRGISGGETRLIALARALVRDSEILLLDEPTASLDRDSENSFLEALSKISTGKTVVIVAHRRELIDFAQKIIELKPNEDLLANNMDNNDNEDEQLKANEDKDQQGATVENKLSNECSTADDYINSAGAKESHSSQELNEASGSKG